MSVTAAVWLAIAVSLLFLSLKRPAWAVALYIQTFFAAPQLWWWSKPFPQLRYALWAGVILLVSTILYRLQSPSEDGLEKTSVHKIAVVMLVNATLVHLLLAVNQTISLDTYTELLKFTLLAYLMWFAIRDRADFKIVLMAIALGGLYLGWEVTINERGDFTGSRLEGVGAPGADTANGLASVMLTVLPIAASLLIQGNWKQKAVAVIGAPLILNVVLLCNSRGAFLGLIGAGATFTLLARGAARKQALRAIGLGAIALFLLLGDPKIMDRFLTTFVGSEERDNSADSRIAFWKSGLLMLQDYPLGAGGGSYKFVLGSHYQRFIVGDNATDRSIHNGYLTEATDWGYQGLGLKLAFFLLSVTAAYRTVEISRKSERPADALLGLCLISGAVAFLITCVFGSYLNNEWSFWVAALCLRYSQVYREKAAMPAAVPEPAAALGGPRAA